MPNQLSLDSFHHFKCNYVGLSEKGSTPPTPTCSSLEESYHLVLWAKNLSHNCTWRQEGNFELLKTYYVYARVIKTAKKSSLHLWKLLADSRSPGTRSRGCRTVLTYTSIYVFSHYSWKKVPVNKQPPSRGYIPLLRLHVKGFGLHFWFGFFFFCWFVVSGFF